MDIEQNSNTEEAVLNTNTGNDLQFDSQDVDQHDTEKVTIKFENTLMRTENTQDLTEKILVNNVENNCEAENLPNPETINSGAKSNERQIKSNFNQENDFEEQMRLFEQQTGCVVEPQENLKENLSMNLRLADKNWKVRKCAYESLVNTIKNSQEDALEVFRDHSESFDKIPEESNSATQESGLELLNEMFNVILLNRAVRCDFDYLLKKLCEKVQTQNRPAIKSKACEIIKKCFELDKVKVQYILEAMLAQLKQVKLIAGVTYCIDTLVLAFGDKIEFMKLLNPLEKCLGVTNPAIRTSVYRIYAGGILILGDKLKKVLDSLLKATQIQEIEKQKIEIESSEAYIKLKAENEAKNGKNSMGDTLSAGSDNRDGKADKDLEEEFDRYDFKDAVDVLSKYGNDWCDKVLKTEKWSEKKALVDEFIKKATDAVKILPHNNAHNLITLSKKLQGNNNLAVQICGIKIITVLANCLRKSLTFGVKNLFSHMLLKLKERKQVAGEALECLNCLLFAGSIEDIPDEVNVQLSDNKTSKDCKINIFKHLMFYIKKKLRLALTGDENNFSYKSFLKNFGNSFKSVLENDPAAEVRNEASEFLAFLLKKRPEDISMNNILNEVNSNKANKIRESAGVTNNTNPGQASQNCKNDPSVCKSALYNKETPIDYAGLNQFSQSIPLNPKDSVYSVFTNKPRTDEFKNATQEMIRPRLKKDDAWNFLLDIGFQEDTLNKMFNGDWKTRSTCFDKLFDFCERNIVKINTKPQGWENVITIVSSCTKDFKESNVLLIKSVIDFLINLLTRINTKYCAKCCYLVSQLVFEKYPDSKFTQKIKELSDQVVERISPKIFMLAVTDMLNNGKNINPKNQSELISLISDYITPESIQSGIPKKELIASAKQASISQHAAVRKSVIKLYCKLYAIFGESLVKNHFNDLNANFKKSLEQELALIKPKVDENQSVKASVMEKSNMDNNIKGSVFSKENFSYKMNQENLNNGRFDISIELNKIIPRLQSDARDTRKAAQDDIEKILNNYHNITFKGIIDFVTHFKPRLTDTNKQIQKLAFSILVKLVSGLGSLFYEEFKPNAKVLIESLLSNLGEKHFITKNETKESFKRILEIIPKENQDFIMTTILKLISDNNPETRLEALALLTENFTEEQILKLDWKRYSPQMAHCLLDKAPKIRTNAEIIVTIIVRKFGLSYFENNIKTLNESNLRAIKDSLKRMFSDKMSMGTNDFSPPKNSNIDTSILNKIGSVLGKNLNQFQMNNSATFSEQMHMTTMPNTNEILNAVGLNKFGNNSLKRNLNDDFGNQEDALTRPSVKRFSSNTGLSNSMPPAMVGNTLNNSTNSASEFFDPKAMNNNISLLPVKHDSNECVINYNCPSDEFVNQLKAYFKAILGSSNVDKMFSVEKNKVIESLKMLKMLRDSDWNKFKNHFSFLLKWVYLRIFDTNSIDLLRAVKDFLVECMDQFFNSRLAMNDIKDTETLIHIVMRICSQLRLSQSFYHMSVEDFCISFSRIAMDSHIVNIIFRIIEQSYSCLETILLMLKYFAKNFSIINLLSLNNLQVVSLLQTSNLPQAHNASENIINDLFAIKKAAESVIYALYERHGEKIIDLCELYNQTSIVNNLRTTFPKDKPKYSSTVDISYLISQLMNGDDDVLSYALEKLNEMIETCLNNEDLSILKIRGPELANTINFLFTRIDQIYNKNQYFDINSVDGNTEDVFKFVSKLESDFYKFQLNLVSLKTFVETINENLMIDMITNLMNQLLRITELKQTLTKSKQTAGNSNILEGPIKQEKFEVQVEQVFQIITNIMNAILENGRINILFGTLLEILTITKRNMSSNNQINNTSNFTNSNFYNKLMQILVKCTQKVTKNLTSNIEESCPDLIQYKLNLYLKEFGKVPNESDLGIRLVKTIIYELCNNLNSKIWDYHTKIDIQNLGENDESSILTKYIKHFLNANNTSHISNRTRYVHQNENTDPSSNVKTNKELFNQDNNTNYLEQAKQKLERLESNGSNEERGFGQDNTANVLNGLRN